MGSELGSDPRRFAKHYPIARILLWLFAFSLLAFGALLTVGGGKLFSIGGSAYYALAGLGLVAVGALLLRGGPSGPGLYAILLGATIVWGLAEVGTDAWALLPRLATFVAIGLWMIAPWTVNALGGPRRSCMAVACAVIAAVGVMLVAMLDDYAVAPARERTRLESAAENTDWRHYGGSTAGTRYSPLDQITADNVAQLREVWRYRTGITGAFKSTPLQIGQLLYLCTNYNHIIALDAETGREAWRHDPRIEHPGMGQFGETCRGVSYYAAPADYSGECPARIVSGTTDARLIAIDALTGERCRAFGDDGEIDLTDGMGDVPRGHYFVTSPPLIAGDRAVVGGWIVDNVSVGEPSGVVRAFDVVTGEMIWAWDLGRPGATSKPPPGEHYTRGTPNVWSIMSYDPDLGLIYAPTGNATPDYFAGTLRTAEMEAYSSSVVALDAGTGAPRWTFQTVHHDIWDYDVASQPVLVDLPQDDGSIIPALAAPTKRGEIFLLDRRDGTPIAAVEERPVPQGAAPLEVTSPTQPFSVGMPHFRPELEEADMWGLTPVDQLWCRIEFRSLRYDGHFTPPTVEGSIQFPGNVGGFNWGSVAADEHNGILIAAPMIMASRVSLIARDGSGRDLQLNQTGTPYGVNTYLFLSPLRIPCVQPPYSRVAAIDLQTRELLWSRPLGSARGSGPFGWRSGIDLTIGAPVYGGPIVTKGGVIFIGATMDRSLRAFDVRDGRVLWRAHLPGNAHSTPMSYRAPRSGRQMIVVTVPSPSWRYPGTQQDAPLDPAGGYVVAFALAER